MTEGPGTILGGLPVVAVITGGKDADTPSGPGEYWTEVVSIHWMKRDGSKGKEIPAHIRERAGKYDYQFGDLTEQVWDHLNYEQWLEGQAPQGDRSPEGGDGLSGSVHESAGPSKKDAPNPCSSTIEQEI